LGQSESGNVLAATLLVTNLAYSSKLKKESICSSETLVDFHWATIYCIQEHGIVDGHRSHSLKTNIFRILFYGAPPCFLSPGVCSIVSCYIPYIHTIQYHKQNSNTREHTNMGQQIPTHSVSLPQNIGKHKPPTTYSSVTSTFTLKDKEIINTPFHPPPEKHVRPLAPSMNTHVPMKDTHFGNALYMFTHAQFPVFRSRLHVIRYFL
jgi:hypothetical protein